MSSKSWTLEELRKQGYIINDEPEVHSITNAESPHSENVNQRFRSYAFKMFLRIVCIVAALFTHGWIMWACIIAAGILPWVAVVLANGNTRARNEDFSAYLTLDQQRALESSATPQSSPEDAYQMPPKSMEAEEEIIEGEVLRSETSTAQANK